MAGMVFAKDHFFENEEDVDQLANIVEVLGTSDLYAFMEKYGLSIEKKKQKFIKESNPVPFTDFINQENSHLVSEEAIDLLQW